MDNRTNGLTNKHDSCLIKCAQNASLNDFSSVFARYWCERALRLGYRNVAGAGGVINDHVFLVNASLGLYPELLQDSEAFKTRFGRSRLVAFGSALVTIMGVHRLLKLRIERGTDSRDISTSTLFIGNNRLQLEQAGLAQASALDQGCLAAVILRPIGVLAMLWLLLRGSFGTLGEADTIESFQFHRMVVRPRYGWAGLTVKVAFDGEVSWMRTPLEFKVSAMPLYLIKPVTEDGATGHSGGDT